MILAQSYEVHGWQAIIVVLGVILVKGIDWLKEIIAYKKDSKETSDKQELEKEKAKYLERIARSNEAQEKQVSELNVKLTTLQTVNDERHAANLDRFKTVCHYNNGQSS